MAPGSAGARAGGPESPRGGPTRPPGGPTRPPDGYGRLPPTGRATLPSVAGRGLPQSQGAHAVADVGARDFPRHCWQPQVHTTARQINGNRNKRLMAKASARNGCLGQSSVAHDGLPNLEKATKEIDGRDDLHGILHQIRQTSYSSQSTHLSHFQTNDVPAPDETPHDDNSRAFHRAGFCSSFSHQRW